MINKKLSEKIRSRRKELKMSQEELASLVGYTDRSIISRIEKGLIDLTESKIMAIAKALKVTPEILVGWEEKPKEKENNIFSQLTEEELAKLEKFNNMSTVMFMNEGNDISDKDKETLAIAYAEVLISQRKKWCIMTLKHVIDTAQRLLKEYGNIYNLIKDKGIILKYVDLDSSIRGLSIDNIIFINSNISDFDKEFVIAHEVGHYELHDDSIRQFSKIEAFKGSREETQANLFATVFLEANYKDCNSDNEIQKIINYIWCNYLNNFKHFK